MEGRKLVFRRVRKPEQKGRGSRAKTRASSAENRHPLFGAMKGLIRITPGTDLTKPADPHWGDVWDRTK
jgi:hypothetical protein